MPAEDIIYSSTLVILTIYAVYLRFRLGAEKLNYLWIYLFATCMVDVVAQLKSMIFSEVVNNGILYKYYLIFSINFFAFFYFQVFKKGRRMALVIVTVLLNIGLLINIDFTSPIFEDMLSIAFPMWYVFLALMWFQYKLTQDMEKKITEEPYFWVSSGLLIWGGFLFFRIVPAKYLAEYDPQFHKTLISINFLVSTLMYLLFFVALLKFKKQEKE